jgi:diguanylate cyclase (GGDEF)-like protein/PAS domain S-box-containing protein
MRLSEFILYDLEAILQEWETFAASLLEPHEMLDKIALRDHAKDILSAIAVDLTEPQTEWEEKKKSSGHHDLLDAKGQASITHGKERLASGFSLNEAVAEYRALRASVIRRWQKSLLNTEISDVQIRDMIRFNEAIDQSISQSATSYTLEKEQQARVFHSILSSLPDLCFTFALDTRFAYVNKAMSEFFSRPSSEIVGKQLTDLDPLHGIDIQHQVEHAIRAKTESRGEINHPNPSGQMQFFDYLLVPVLDEQGTVEAVVGMARNMTERKQREDRVWHAANHDALTNLPNRRLFLDRLEQQLKHATRIGSCTALLFIDLDAFKEANDRFGHETGDRLLQHVADRLRLCVRDSDPVARLGGDEFCVILVGWIDIRSIELVAGKILTVLASPFSILNHTVQISASIGIALSPQDAGTPEDLIKKADQAMYAAKMAGRNQFRFFTSLEAA